LHSSLSTTTVRYGATENGMHVVHVCWCFTLFW
jgi:hypothetical protein